MAWPQPQRSEGMLELVWKGADSPHSGIWHLDTWRQYWTRGTWVYLKFSTSWVISCMVGQFSVQATHLCRYCRYRYIVCRYRGLAPALEPVLLLQPGHAVILRAVEEDRTVVLTDLIALTCGDR